MKADPSLKLAIGTKVHYIPFEGCDPSQHENGVIKSHNPMMLDSVFVVYHCGNDWKNYMNYTGALTNINQLRSGWV